MKILKTISEIKSGDFIKIVQTNGPVSDRLNLSGKVIMVTTNPDRLEIHTTTGIVGIGWEMEGIDLEVSRLKQKPNGWDAHMKNPSPPQIEPIAIKTTKEKVFDLVKDNPRKKFPRLLSLAKKEIGGNEATLTANIQLALMKSNRLNPV